MKNFICDFLRRGSSAFGFGPLVLAILYPILHQNGVLQTLTASEVSIGILSLSVLAFIAGGMNAIYQIEHLPLMVAVTIHGIVLYISYLGTYLINNWLEWGILPIVVFSAIFIVGYIIIWAIIYSVIRKNTQKVNHLLKQKQTATSNTEK